MKIRRILCCCKALLLLVLTLAACTGQHVLCGFAAQRGEEH